MSSAPVAAAPVMRARPAESISAAAAPRPVKQPAKAHKRGYTAAWGLAGVFAAAYAGAVLVGQEPMTTVVARWAAQDRDNTEMAAALARTQTEVAQLQKTVDTLEGDMSRVKSQVSETSATLRTAAARIDAVETRVDKFGAQMAQTFAKAAPAQKGAQVAARPTGAAIETGAITPKEPAPGRELAAARHAAPDGAAASVAPSATTPQSAILLARGPSLDALRLSWSLLNERHKAALGTLEPRVVQSEPGTYQLVAGPIATAADAGKVCANLKARGVTCQPAEFKGDGL